MLEVIKKHHLFIDKVNPLTKILTAVLLFVLVVIMNNPNDLFYLTLLMMLTLLILSGVKYQYLAVFIMIVVIFGIFSSMYMILYGEGQTTIFKYGFVHVTEESLIRGLHVMMRGVALSFFGALIIFTTKLTDIFYSLMIQAKLKPKFAYSFMASIRMVPIIAGEYMMLRRVRKVRKPLIHKKYISGIKGFTTTVITLLSQSIRRAYRLGIAMEAKQFDDGPRTYYHETKFTRYDIYFISYLVILLIIAFLLGDILQIIDTIDAR
jgi:energy-coupling factor transport system permease protein